MEGIPRWEFSLSRRIFGRVTFQNCSVPVAVDEFRDNVRLIRLLLRKYRYVEAREIEIEKGNIPNM